MVRKVITAKMESSATGYDNRWRLTLSCGHVMTAPRKATLAVRNPKAPTKQKCVECEEQAKRTA